MAAGLATIAVRALNRHTRLAEARSTELELFAARVAHDVRDPLGPALHAMRQARANVDPAGTVRGALDRGIRSLDRVARLVDELFEFAKAGGASDGHARCSALAAARACIEETGRNAEAAGIDLLIDPASVDCVVACGSGALGAVLSNLVRNAIKYMGRDRSLRRVVVRIQRAGAVARLDVQDSGPGIPARALPTLFEPYVRADRTGQPGLGLGLATVKRLVEAHGGRIGVRSNEQGSTFSIEFPVVA